MIEDQPSLYATLRKHGGEVRRLIIEPVNGHAHVRLTQLCGITETPIAEGSRHEMQQKGDLLMQQWSAEGFRWKKTEDLVYEPLPAVVALALKMGHTSIYNGDRKALYKETPLSEWRGMSPLNNGAYEYALAPLAIHARPAIPNGMFTELPADGAGIVSMLSEVIAYRDSIGPERKFLIAGSIF